MSKESKRRAQGEQTRAREGTEEQEGARRGQKESNREQGESEEGREQKKESKSKKREQASRTTRKKSPPPALAYWSRARKKIQRKTKKNPSTHQAPCLSAICRMRG